MSLEKLPVILVTGFLGSGKTTLLRHIAASRPDLKMVFLVNEFAETDVDGSLISGSDQGREALSVVGGSLFCECKASEFVRIMKERIAPMGRTQRLDAVVIETSGIADPEAVGKIMSDYGLDDNFAISQIVSVVAPAKFLQLVTNLRSIEAQVRTSDRVIVNKVDLADEKTLQAVESKIREINPKAEVVRASHCKVDVLSGESSSTPLPLGDLTTCDSNPFSTETIVIDRPVDLGRLKECVHALPSEILRIKGYVETQCGWHYVSRSVDEVLFEAVCDENLESALVFIAHDLHEDLLISKIESFKKGVFDECIEGR